MKEAKMVKEEKSNTRIVPAAGMAKYRNIWDDTTGTSTLILTILC